MYTRTIVGVEPKPEPEPELEQMEMSITEFGESSQTFCEICSERKERDEMFKIEGCVHSYCFECISKYVATKIHNNIITITCPDSDCKSVLEFDSCKHVLAKETLALWLQQRPDRDENGIGDPMLKALAKKMKWKQCPRCNITIEKTEGCKHMTCRCGCHFCYRCGLEYWYKNHCGCLSA